MSDYTKIIIEVDERGRMSISAVDDEGYGGGYRLAGPKYLGDDAPIVAQCVLQASEVEAIRWYLETWDEIQGKKTVIVDATDEEHFYYLGNRIAIADLGDAVAEQMAKASQLGLGRCLGA